MSSRWESLADQTLSGIPTTEAQAMAVLESTDQELPALLAACFRVRHRYFERYVRFHYLFNAQSGLCPEDCHYCSQSHISTAAIAKYPLKSREEMQSQAARAVELGATTFCVVMSGRGPSDRHVEELCSRVTDIKAKWPLRICACLGIVTANQAQALQSAGVERYNHNLNTSPAFTPAVVSTHTYEDRRHTVETVKSAHLSPCSGAIFGMGESAGDRVAVALALRDLAVDSIPINFLHPIAGTPFADKPLLSPQDCLRAVVMMRFVNPRQEIRLAGGREVQLRSLQPLALYAANSLFVADYLTTPGQDPAQDHAMVHDLGFIVEPPGLTLPC